MRITSNGNWTIVNGEARYVPVKKFTTSAIYTDLCLDNFSAESSIKSISTVFEAYHPTLSSSLILNYVPRGDGTDGDLQAITGYKFTLQKTIGTTSSVASVSKLTDYILIPGQTPTSRQRVDFCTKTGVVFDHTVANLLRVVKTGRRLQFFVNGVLQCETQVGDDRFRSVGILATADIVNAGADPGRYTAVDYLRLTGKSKNGSHKADRLELAGLFGERHFGGKPLHRGRPIEAVAVFGVPKNITGVIRH